MPRRQLPLPFGPIRNSNLLSNHWLKNRLPLEPEWTERRQEALGVLGKLERLWQGQRDRVELYGNEQQLEYAFIQPVFEALGWKPVYQTFLRGRRPDYALFLDDAALGGALRAGPKTEEFWRFPKLLADAKAWHISLDRRAAEGDREYPPEQIERYLDRSHLDYAILTNGRQWRLIPRHHASYQPRFETYLECDLAALLNSYCSPALKGRQLNIEQQDFIRDEFVRFFLFFSPASYSAAPGRDLLIDRALTGSSQYRLGVGEGLKDRVFEALRLCIEGLLKHPANGLSHESDLARCREESFTLLYRLLFIMYAEDRRFLPYQTNDDYTQNRSLGRHRDDIIGRLERIADGRADDYLAESTALWRHLASLFDLIDGGHAPYGVPRYNGGLFDPKRHPFLKEKVIADPYLARVIDQLGRAPDPDHPAAELCRVDYRDLAIQHLGSIYEGLLELHPQFAAQTMLRVRKSAGGKGEVRPIAQNEPLPDDCEYTGASYAPGAVYLLTDKGERRSSGSYYTPDHIVDHIVVNTLAPLCKDIAKSLDAELEKVEKSAKASSGANRAAYEKQLEALRTGFGNRILALRILDLSMGSGHFLLRACQFLAEEIATNPHSGDPATLQLSGDESVLTYWKRRVVERCLYGVDLNPMAVELAKLALWLETVAVNQPLSFLDHHLRHGNSLVGAEIRSLGALPSNKETLFTNAFASQVEGLLPALLQPLVQIRQTPSETAEQIKEKEKLYREAFEPKREPFARVADLWTATFFLGGGKEQIKDDWYRAALEALGTADKFKKLRKADWFAKAVAAAQAPAVAAFHWELEFPEVFFAGNGRNGDAGFDAIIGNPPYDVLAEKELGVDLSALQAFLKSQAMYEPSFRGKNNLYKLFICRALYLLAEGGRFGFITPMAVLGDDQAAAIRREILSRGAFTSIDAFPQKDDPRCRVFAEAKLSTAVFTLVKTEDANTRRQPFTARVHPAEKIDDTAPSFQLATEQIPLYDPTNFSIVTCSQHDWDLALKVMAGGRMARLQQHAEFFQGEINETNERAKGNLLKPDEGGRLVTRGASICLYVTRPASQGTDLYLNVPRYLQDKGPETKAHHHHYPRVGLQESCPQNNFRRIIAALIPAGEFCNHKVNYLPEHKSQLPLPFAAALLNSKLSDWYFRLGSTNAAVSHYQLYNLPCPVFAAKLDKAGERLRKEALAFLDKGDPGAVLECLRPALAGAPFSRAILDAIVELVNRIGTIEAARGPIARTERSHLAPAAQPLQDLIDRLFYALAGLTDAEAAGLEARLAQML